MKRKCKSNMQKDIEAHSKAKLRPVPSLRMADGGLVSKRLQDMERMAGAPATTALSPNPGMASMTTPPTAAPAEVAPVQPQISPEEIALRQKYGMAVPGAEKPSLIQSIKKKFGFADGGEVSLRDAIRKGQLGRPPVNKMDMAKSFVKNSMPDMSKITTPILDVVAPMPEPDLRGTREVNMARMVPHTGEQIRLTEPTIGVRGAHGGEVDGPGGPTDDEIPALLSDGEYVLPADVVKKVGKKKLDKLVEENHEYEDVSLRDGYADGGYIDPRDPRTRQPAFIRSPITNVAGIDPVASPRTSDARLDVKAPPAKPSFIRTDVPGSAYFNDQMNEAKTAFNQGKTLKSAMIGARGLITSPLVAAAESGHRVLSELAPVGRGMVNATGYALGADDEVIPEGTSASLPRAPVAAATPSLRTGGGFGAGDEVDRGVVRPGMTVNKEGVARFGNTFTNVPNESLDGGTVSTISSKGMRALDPRTEEALSAALAAASARGDHEAVRDFYQKGGGTFRGSTAEQDAEQDMVASLRKTPGGQRKLAGYLALKDQNAAIRERTAATTKAAAAAAALEQSNKDRQYKLDVERFGVETAEKNRAAAAAADKAVTDSLESRFRTRDDKGNSVPDHNKIAAFKTTLAATLPQMIAALEASGKPEGVTKAKLLRARGAAALEPGDYDDLQQLFDRRERMRAAAGIGPNAGEFSESDNLLDYQQTGIEPRTFGGNRLKTKAGSVSLNDLRYSEGPANAFFPDFFKTETRNLTRNVRKDK